VPQHNARTTYSRWRWLPAIGVLLLGLPALGFATAYSAAPTPVGAGSGSGSACPTLRVVTASSFAPVLDAVAPAVSGGPACTHVAVTVADGRGAAARAAALDADVWIPDDAAWSGDHGALALAQPPAAGAGAVLATSPLYLVTDPATARRIAKSGGGWRALAGLVTAPGSQVRLVSPAPGGSGDGLLAIGAVGEAVWQERGMDASAEALAAALPRTRIVSDGEPATPDRLGEVGLVTERELLDEPEQTAGGTVVAPADNTAELRYSWFPSAAAAADPTRARALDTLRSALTGTAADKALAQAGLRRPGGARPPEPLPRDLPPVVAPAFEAFDAHRVDHVLASSYPEDRRADVLVAVDISGSMWAQVPPSGESLIDVVKRGVGSLSQLLPDDARMTLWEFGTHLDGPRDYRVLRENADLAGGGRQEIGAAVAALTPTDTGTGLHDTILAAYRSAQQAYRNGTPSHVVVFTDGRNEADQPTISIAELKDALARAMDPTKPVSLAVMTFGDEPDAAALTDALKPVDGYVDRLSTAEEVGAAFIHLAAGGLHG
jgi:Bacterial extracellular solute-binding protein/von Willebrand factor type A domain